MRVFGLLLAAVLLTGIVGCLAPYAWQEPRPEAVPDPAINADEALTKAADLLDQGQDREAVPHLKVYIQANPDAVMVRAQLAELLFRQQNTAESQEQFEAFVGLAQRMTGRVNQHLIHVHTRLMELAARQEDDFSEELHRGIGLLLLVKKWQAAPDRRDADTEEQTLMKAVRALRTAQDLQPDNPRGWLYLGEAYELLNQAGPAREAYRGASERADYRLTPTEQDKLSKKNPQ